MTDEKFQILPNQQPVLKGGNYVLEITLTKDQSDEIEKVVRYFTISGEPPAPQPPVSQPLAPQPPDIQVPRTYTDSRPKFARASLIHSQQKIRALPFRPISPGDIHAVFPPAGSLGDHSDDLPHIILNRSTLPWEYRAISDKDEIPWLALLLFDETETPELQAKTLEDLQKENPAFPEFELGPGQNMDDKVTVIDVQRDLLERILPAADDLKYLAHVRRGSDSREFSVVVGNRLPNRDSTSTIHLVSVAGRYKADGEFDYQDATQANGLIRLVSLNNWRFACQDEQQNFASLLLNRNSGTLRLPKNDNADAEKYLAKGCVPLRHTTREGTKTVSWYHGPLLPGENITAESDLPIFSIQASDQLMRFDKDLGVFDVSYAAAWELGRFLALQSKAFSTELYNWKRSYAQSLQSQKLQQANREWTHLPLSAPAPALELPSIVKTWFEGAKQLQGIPLNYLVPDERMLPPESIRFFSLDWMWLEYLQKGAFSLGRVTKRDDELYASVTRPSRQTTGFLLRSDVVAGWPGLLVDGDAGAPLLRMDRLSKDILICLFDGRPKTVDFHLKPEAMHFGVDGPDEGSTKFYVLQNDGSVDKKIDIPWHNEGSKVINIKELAERMETITSAQFASQMVEEVEMVRLITYPFKQTVHKPPVLRAHAKGPKTVRPEKKVTLSGEAFKEKPGDIPLSELSFQWTLLSKPEKVKKVKLGNTRGRNITVTLTGTGTYVFQFKASTGKLSATSQVEVKVVKK